MECDYNAHRAILPLLKLLLIVDSRPQGSENFTSKSIWHFALRWRTFSLEYWLLQVCFAPKEALLFRPVDNCQFLLRLTKNQGRVGVTVDVIACIFVQRKEHGIWMQWELVSIRSRHVS